MVDNKQQNISNYQKIALESYITLFGVNRIRFFEEIRRITLCNINNKVEINLLAKT